ncbi:lysophospholipid acyltransferase family protein [Streptantibioticus ferralitis]|uniref:Lysophospholipid acyltransferase family protein n=1 Tax=Streptantibioticus ferralitis TaxID=236510 RepID=A0ABT5Z7T0_9ACTN|nr:lysophospholipid acyltransferase family protein [Streptantibioticus ferralitis]MDF2259783.1 lysophospholipid acyltransferase family protein [Streptantibioticus ferralitis]
MADAKVIPFDEDTRARRGARAGDAAGARSGSGEGGGGRRAGRSSGARRKAKPAGQPGLAAVTPEEDTVRRGGARQGKQPVGVEAAGPDERGQEDVSVPDETDTDAQAAGGDTARGLPAPLGALTDALGGAADRLLGGRWDRRVAGGLAFLRRRITGDYEVDEFGYDEELTDQVLMSLLRPLFDTYFRIEVKGVENIPSQGGALVVANHSGTLPLDALMAQVAVHDHHPAGRHLRLLAADLVFVLPVVNELARKAGHTLACTEDAQLLLERGEVVGVMPEGFKGLGKPFSDRYKLQRFGRGGFVSTALRTGVPIVPCSIVGAEEIYPMVGNAKMLARLLGFPYFPLTPTFPWLGPLGMVPLPTKWTIQFGEPIATDGFAPEAADDPMLVFNLTDQVRETIQHTLYKLLVQRRSVFF